MNVFEQLNGARPVEAIWRYEDVRVLGCTPDGAPKAAAPTFAGNPRWWAGMPLLRIACRMQAGRLVVTRNSDEITAMTNRDPLPDLLGVWGAS